jgi:hypothetical protein
MTIPTWLMYLFLSVAALGPYVSLWPRWWIAYYGALLVCWVGMSVADVRRAAREERRAQGGLARTLRRFPTVPAMAVGTAQTDADAGRPGDATRRGDTGRPALVEDRLIIVARDKVDLYNRIRRDELGHGDVTVIADRRRTDRRRKLEMFIPERRLGERRRLCDVSQLLLTRGWAEVTVPKPVAEDEAQQQHGGPRVF